ncbi:MAG: FAD-dependent oxidoreductase [Chloroflexi bacterium]|nr:FAD-dependent oxidoreductase [Chloroflexota bacterium]
MANKKIGSTLIIGAGVAGMQAALDLADSGIKVYLQDEKPAIGGTMVALDKTFPTNDCAMCSLSPRLVAISNHPNITMLTHSEIKSVSGEAGNFTVTINKKPRYIDEEKCTGCDLCIEKCPYKAISEFDQGMGKRKAIYKLYAQSTPNFPVIDTASCAFFFKDGKCHACELVCDPKAIRLDDTAKLLTLNVGAILVTTGFNLYDASERSELGFGRYANVLTSLQLERLISASGPTVGNLQRPSDKQMPKSIGFLQCVGSRTEDANFCSSVCCMYATKEAIIIKEYHPEVDITIYYTDLRAYGKGFEAYFERAKVMGIKYVRCQLSTIKEEPSNKNLNLRYITEDGKLADAQTEMMVLSCGLRPSKSADSIFNILGLKTQEDGFVKTESYEPVLTNKEGIYVAGVATGSRDIPDSVVQANSASSKILSLLKDERGTLVTEKIYPEERDILGEELRIGVIVCHCGKNIAGVLDIDDLVKYSQTLPGVVFATNQMFACSTDTGAKTKEAIVEHNLNRLVVAACSPKTHLPVFQELLAETGLNPYLVEMSNIRNHCSWVHAGQNERATAKAKDMIRMTVASASHLNPLHPLHVKIVQEAAVIGGGAAGMSAALEIAEQGYKTILIERTDKLGGNMITSRYLNDKSEAIPKLNNLISKVKNHKNISLYMDTELTDFGGSAGNFSLNLRNIKGTEAKINTGVVIVATGGTPYTPKTGEFLYSQDSRVVRQGEVPWLLADTNWNIKRLVSIQCVGSRNDEHKYCSRVCCVNAVRNAVVVKQQHPETDVIILYRDMRTYSLYEKLYNEARDLGVRFIRFNDGDSPQVAAQKDALYITVNDALLGQPVTITADKLALSIGVAPSDGTSELGKLLKTTVGEDGFFLEAHIKLRPVDFATDGIFLCGLAASPKLLEEAIAQAQATAARAALIIGSPTIKLEASVANVIPEHCDGCGYCVETCPYGAISLVELVEANGVAKSAAKTDPVRCHGCGTCAGTCPKRGMQVLNFTGRQIMATVDAALQVNSEVELCRQS